MIGNRLKRYLDAKGYKVTKFAGLTGISQGALSDYLNEKRDPQGSNLEKIIRRTDISAHWLLTGEGDMLRAEALNVHQEAIHDGPTAEYHAGRDPIISSLLDKAEKVLQSENTVMRGALASNILAFHEAIEASVALSDKDREIEGMKRDIEALKRIIHPNNLNTEAKEQ